MITTLLFDLGNVLLFSRDRIYNGKLNPLYEEHFQEENFNFFEYFELNKEMLDFLLSQKRDKLICIFTEGTIQNVAEIKQQLESVFVKIYSGKTLGINKKDRRSYEFIVKDLGKDPKEVLFIDDSEENLKTAKSAGLHTFQYVDNQGLITKIKSL